MTSHWIIGPGAIGRLLAHSLSPVATVTLVGRGELAERQTLTSPEGKPHTQLLKAVTVEQLLRDAPAPPTSVHITTKAMAAQAALDSLVGVISPTTPVVLWQNGFLAQPRITEAWPGPVLCATTTEGAYVNGETGVVHAGRGHTFIGDLDNRHAELAKCLALQLTNAGLVATAVEDIRRRLWQKLAVNAAINPLVARYRIRNGQLRDRPFRLYVEAVIGEVAGILDKEGIAPPSGAGLEGWRALVWQVVDNTANNRASMFQDVLAGRPTERAAILGPLIDNAKRHQLPCEQLVALDQALESIEAQLS
ncbi:ketopantoate reductase family protein [Vreelandella rituensis]|uniref:2-dehydropantoate 2-reductase n=1 Tax=Vreelandella rituensis TaxID=2282306 RepID=A0A368TTW4_9GAMM|nr:ketopantoate reductase family protein [Halomonas rituensis]RCV88080.1 ketopantoate reductase family protein [Halomonas rituensis]